jgi:mRNA-degrading endonuclease RelE of RelBE toxin-antitoxin system
MLFIETPLFTKLVQDFLSHDSYVELQQTLILRPETGKLIPGSGGLRKMRWGDVHRGKRSGFRVIYYWDVPHDVIYMLLIYKKAEQEDLTPDQVRILRRLIQEYLE